MSLFALLSLALGAAHAHGQPQNYAPMAFPAGTLGRCTEPGCPFRWRDGTDRPCADHDGARYSALDPAMLQAPDGTTRRSAPPDPGRTGRRVGERR